MAEALGMETVLGWGQRDRFHNNEVHSYAFSIYFYWQLFVFFKGPYIGYGDRFWNCGDKSMLQFSLRVSHFNPMKPTALQRVTGYINSSEPVDDNLWVSTP